MDMGMMHPCGSEPENTPTASNSALCSEPRELPQFLSLTLRTEAKQSLEPLRFFEKLYLGSF